MGDVRDPKKHPPLATDTPGSESYRLLNALKEIGFIPQDWEPTGETDRDRSASIHSRGMIGWWKWDPAGYSAENNAAIADGRAPRWPGAVRIALGLDPGPSEPRTDDRSSCAVREAPQPIEGFTTPAQLAEQEEVPF